MSASPSVSQHGQQDVPSNPTSKRRKHTRKKRATRSRSLSQIAAADSGSGSKVGPSTGTPSTGPLRYGCAGGYPEEGAQDKALNELAIDVIPTSSSKRCHSASVVLRGTVDSEVGLCCSGWLGTYLYRLPILHTLHDVPSTKLPLLYIIDGSSVRGSSFSTILLVFVKTERLHPLSKGCN